MTRKNFWLSHNTLTAIALGLGILCGLINHDVINIVANAISDVTIRLMKLIALPLLFLSVVSSAAHFKDFTAIRKLGTAIVKYTLLTTVIAALVAEGLYLLLSPHLLRGTLEAGIDRDGRQQNFFDILLNMIPENVVGAFLSNNVIAVVLMAIFLALAILSIKNEEKAAVFNFFLGLLSAMMKIVQVGLKFIPISVWAFVCVLTTRINSDETDSVTAIVGLTLTVIAANIIQGTVVLPILLLVKGQRPFKLFTHVKEALLVAFFTRSSMATLPVTLNHAINDAKISEDVAKLSLPLSTTINMNGCAQFILLSVYFVSAYSGQPLSSWEHIGMIFLSVIAAVGNAGVPMGCFFLASSILASNDIPLHIMGSILPLYTFIDMVETSLNVWSDVVVAKIVDVEVRV